MRKIVCFLGEIRPISRFSQLMWSYPNYISLSASAVERIVAAVEPIQCDRIYGPFWDGVIDRDGEAVVKESAERYLRAIGR